jgi:hypothetical protein
MTNTIINEMNYQEYIEHDKVLCLICGCVLINDEKILDLHFSHIHGKITTYNVKYLVELPN